MSDAQGITEQSNTAPMATNPAETPAARRSHSGRWIRLLATLGALIFAYAMWLPWAVITTTVGARLLGVNPVDPNIAFGSHLVKIGDFTPSAVMVATFSVLGLLLAPLLWRPADSLLGAIASHIFGLWTLFATIFVVAFGISPLVSGSPQTLLGDPNSAFSITETGKLALGFWLAAVALIPAWIAVIGLLVSEWRRHAFWHLPGNDNDAPRSLIQLPGAGVLNLGLIIWAYGFLIAAWTSLNCNQTPLFFGSCQGAPASSALFAGLAQLTNSATFSSATDPRMLLFLDPNIARYALGILLGVGAALIFLGVWLRSVTRAFCVWTTLWLITAVAFVGVAYAGVAAIVANPRHFGLPVGAWSGESGVFITLLGLILALVGLVTLIVALFTRRAEE